MEVFVAVVNDVVLWAACPDKTQTLEQIRKHQNESLLLTYIILST